MGRVRERSSRQVRAGPTPPLYIALSPALSRALVSVHTIKYIYVSTQSKVGYSWRTDPSVQTVPAKSSSSSSATNSKASSADPVGVARER